MRKTLFIATLFLFSLNGLAQKGSITGLLLDSTNNESTINYATVSVYKGADSVMTTYKLSNDKGVFKITNLEPGFDYMLVINAWLYNIHTQQVSLSKENIDIDLGEIYLTEESTELEDVVIRAYRPPVIVKKDTIEFNAESFKTLPNAVVEDLLKKLPGVNVSADGSIMVNGRPVSKILVDSKEFFGGDQQIATKNLPANIIDKIQVTDDIQAKRRNPDILEGETPQVINLKLKRAIKKGVFGKLYAGGGAGNLYEAGGIMNMFRDTAQISILGYGNNTNKPGFAMGDIMRIGGMQRTGVNMISMNSNGAYELNGISFGGSMGGGVQSSSGGGINMNTLAKNNTKLSFSYFLGNGKNELNRDERTEQSIGEKTLFSTSLLEQTRQNTRHNFNGRAETLIKKNTTITFETTLSLSNQNTLGLLNTQTHDGLVNLNDAINYSDLKNNSWGLMIPVDVWYDFKKDLGGFLGGSVEFSKRQNDNRQLNHSLTTFYTLQADSLLDQKRNNLIKGTGVNLSVFYNQPLSKKITLSLRTIQNFINNENALSSFEKSPLDANNYILVPDLSETVNQSGLKTTQKGSLKIKLNKSWQVEPGFVLNTIDLNNFFDKHPNFDQHFYFIGGQLNVRYKSINFNYSPRYQEPDIAYIQPVANNTNPLLIQEGNLNLVPTRTHQIYLNIYKYNPEKFLGYNGYMGGSIDNDGIIMSRTVLPDGVQINRPENANGIWSFHINGTINKDYKVRDNKFSITTGFWSNYNNGIVLVNQVKSNNINITFGPRIGGRINLNDVLELSETFSTNFTNSRYDDAFFSNQKYQSYNNDSELVWRINKKLILETNHRWMHYTQNLSNLKNDIQLWNIAATFLTMKNDRLQIKVAANDILNNNTDRSLSVRENYLRDSRTNTLGRHYLLTLTYNIQNFGQKVGGKETMFRF